MPVIIESFHEFAARQQCGYLVVSRQSSVRTGEDVKRIVFANGAVSDGVNQHADPPKDQRTLFTRKREYLATLLKREEAAFEAYKAEVLEQAKLHTRYPRNCPPAPANAPELLREGRAKVMRLRKELAELDEQLVDKQRQRDEEEQRKQEHRDGMKQNALMHEVSAINI